MARAGERAFTGEVTPAPGGLVGVSSSFSCLCCSLALMLTSWSLVLFSCSSLLLLGSWLILPCSLKAVARRSNSLSALEQQPEEGKGERETGGYLEVPPGGGLLPDWASEGVGYG